jgi:putative FmdB family regulatory protein
MPSANLNHPKLCLRGPGEACVKEGSVPTYQYTCTDCGEPVEAVQKFTDDPLTECAACGGRLRKVFSAVGIVFKGSGFYRTDSRNGSVTASDKKDKQPSESSATSGEPASGTNGSPEMGRDKVAKKPEAVSAPAKSSGEKVA